MEPSITLLLRDVVASMPASGWLALGIQAGLLGLLLIASGCFSGSEAALFSLSPTHIEHAQRSTSRFRRMAAKLLVRPKRTLMWILLANTALNIAIFAAAYVLFRDLGGKTGPWMPAVGGGLTVLLVVVFGEVVPKVIAVSSAERVAPLAAGLVQFSGYVLEPAGRIIDWLFVQPVERLILGGRSAAQRHAARLSTQELKALLELSRRRKEINRIEDRFLREVIDLGYLRVRDVMIPRVEVQAYDLRSGAEGLRELMRRTRLKKIPVYEGSIDNIVGVIYAKMLFLATDQPLRSLLMPVRFVPELAMCEQLLHHFRQTRTQLAIAVDEYGGMAGLVTLEDLLETIVGEIYGPDEAPVEPEIRQLSEREYDISGQLSIHYWAELFDLPQRTERIATVGGFVTARLGRPAQIGDSVRLNNLLLEVTRVQRRRIDRIRLRLLSDEIDAGDGA